MIERQNGENDDGERNDARCPNCRVTLKKELTVDYESFRKVHMPNQNKTDDAFGDILGIVASENDSKSDSDSDSESDEGDDYDSEGSDLGGFIVSDDEDDEDDGNDQDERNNRKNNSDTESDEDDEFLNPDGSIDIQKFSENRKSKRSSVDREDSEDIRGHTRRTNKGKDKAKPKHSKKKVRKGRSSNNRQTKSKQPKIRTLADERRLAQRNKKAKKKCKFDYLYTLGLLFSH